MGLSKIDWGENAEAALLTRIRYLETRVRQLELQIDGKRMGMQTPVEKALLLMLDRVEALEERLLAAGIGGRS